MLVRQITSPNYLTDYETGLPIIGWQNLVEIQYISATSERPLFPVTNLANPATHLIWQEELGAIGSNNYLTVQLPLDNSVSPAVAQTINYVAIAKHNFGTLGITVSVETNLNEAGFVTQVTHNPTDDSPIIFQLEPQQANVVRVKLTPAADRRSAAVLYVGNLLTLERSIKIDVEHTPITFGRINNIITGMSESGQFLGRLTKNHSLESSVEFAHFTPDWFRTYMDPFLESAHDVPFFWAWNPLNASDVGYSWVTRDPIAKINPVTGRFSLTIEMRALA